VEIKEIIEFAKKAELDGKALYEEELAKTEDSGIRKILKMLIEAEENHYDYFDSLDDGDSMVEIQSTSLKGVKNVFQEMKDNGDAIITSSDHLSFYEKLLEIEEKAEKFYRDAAENLFGQNVKDALLKIADEEHRHVILAKSFIDMIRNPSQWVEDAEFNNMDDY
jgi:rubrerythrin